MSLEQSILSLADAIREQTRAAIAHAGPLLKAMGALPPDLFTTAENEIAATAVVSLAKKGPGRPKKADAVPASTTPPSVDAANAAADGTTFWHNTRHDAVYRIVPGDGSSPIANSVQISEADFLVTQTRLALKYANLPGMPGNPVKTAASLPTAEGEPVDASPASATTSDFPTARAALLALAKARADGRELVLGILKKHGANSVPELAGKSAEELGSIVAEAAAQ